MPVFSTIADISYIFTAEVGIPSLYLLEQLHSDMNVYFVVIFVRYMWTCAVVSWLGHPYDRDIDFNGCLSGLMKVTLTKINKK